MKGRVDFSGAYCHGYRTGNVNIANGTETTVVINTVVTDPFSMINTSTGVITLPNYGYYIFVASTHWNGESSPISTSYRYINFETDSGTGGVSWGQMSFPSMIRANNAATSDTVNSAANVFGPFDAGDQVRLRVAQGSGETITLFGGVYTNFSVCQTPGKII